MIKYFLILCIISSLIAVKSSFAQSAADLQETPYNFGKCYLGVTGSTNGWGGEVRYIFNHWFTLKSGYETLNLSQDIKYSQDDIEFKTTLDYKTGSIFLIGDFNFTRNVYASAGAMFNNFNPVVSGYAAQDMKYGDITIPASLVGEFTFTITPGMKISPYAALGIRFFFGKHKRVLWTNEIGSFYMGAPEINLEATGLIAPTADPAHGQKQALENQIEQYKFYPVLKMGLAIKLL